MVGIKHLGGCPCPRCKILLKNIPLLGTKADRKACNTLKHHDNLDLKTAISNAHHAIYEKKCGVTSVAVERELDAESLTPASVRILFFDATVIWMTNWCKQSWYYLECIFWQTFSAWIRLVFHISSGPYAWGWTWGLEGFDDSSFADFECNQWKSIEWAWSKVRFFKILEVSQTVQLQ